MGSMAAVMRGLNTLYEYKPDGETWSVDAQHDELFAHGPEPSALSDEDAKQLKDDGWTWSESHFSWHKFT
jgi:hypothetical protein